MSHSINNKYIEIKIYHNNIIIISVVLYRIKIDNNDVIGIDNLTKLELKELKDVHYVNK